MGLKQSTPTNQLSFPVHFLITCLLLQFIIVTMSFNNGYLNQALLPTSGNGKRRWNDGEAGTPPAPSGTENGNATSGNGSPWQAFKRLRVTREDEDGDICMNSPGRFFPPPAMHHSPPPPQQQQQQHQAQHDWGKHQTAGQETSSEHATPVTHNPVQDSPDADYHYVNHALGQLHQERMERERRQAALQNHQHYHDAAHHHYHPTNARSPAVSRARSDSGSGTFHTPPTSRRKVVHLHTNSKLG
jgi:hypothetical protein